jgi:DNA helicase HerA-like ATPase
MKKITTGSPKSFLITALKRMTRPLEIYFLHSFFFKMRKILPLHAFRRHGYVVASSGSGKSELIKILLYRELVKNNPKSSVIVMDPH